MTSIQERITKIETHPATLRVRLIGATRIAHARTLTAGVDDLSPRSLWHGGDKCHTCKEAPSDVAVFSGVPFAFSYVCRDCYPAAWRAAVGDN